MFDLEAKRETKNLFLDKDQITIKTSISNDSLSLWKLKLNNDFKEIKLVVPLSENLLLYLDILSCPDHILNDSISSIKFIRYQNKTLKELYQLKRIDSETIAVMLDNIPKYYISAESFRHELLSKKKEFGVIHCLFIFGIICSLILFIVLMTLLVSLFLLQ